MKKTIIAAILAIATITSCSPPKNVAKVTVEYFVEVPNTAPPAQ